MERLRVEAARFQRRQPMPPQRSNGDERRYADFIGSFSKALTHDAFGIVDAAAYNALRRAMNTADPADFAAIPMGGVAKLSNPQSAFAFQNDGADSHHLDVRVPPALASAEEAGEMVELYWLALTRDVPFANYDIDPGIAPAAADLSALSDFRGPKVAGRVTPETIFRGGTPGDLAGPYVSQFLLRAIPTTARYSLHREILDSPALPAVFARNGTYLLPMAHPEGSPVHPAFPAGHAAFAGAGVTILKAILTWVRSRSATN